MDIHFCNSNDRHYQALLNDLLKPVFFDFQFWYDLGLWNEDYESYSIMQDGAIVSNICVYKTDMLCHGRYFKALSVGAVATREDFRGKGYARLLMEHVLDRYGDIPVFLAANETVTDFYPKFGFDPVTEKLPVAEAIIDNAISPVKLAYDDPKVRNYVYNRVNISDKLDCLNTQPITMFHIHAGYLKDCICELPELETMVIARQRDDSLYITGVFSLRKIGFTDLAKNLPFNGVRKLAFGFMPFWNDLSYAMIDYETDPLFARNLPCEPGDFKFPELSVT